MTILHIDNSVAVTGAYKALLSWCLQNPQWRHVWILPEGSAISADASKHFQVYELPFVEIGRSVSRLLKYLPALWFNARKVKAIIQKEQPDLLHANDLYNMVLYTARRMNKPKLPLVVHARMLKRSFPARIYDFWKQWHLSHAQGVVAVSKAIRNDWDNNERVQVIYDPIAIQEQHTPYRFEYREGEPFRFLYLANYMVGKGQDDALKAIKMLKERGVTDFVVDFYGGTSGLDKNAAYKQQLESFAKEHGLDDVVSFHGEVKDVEAVMKQYHTLLHFSFAESFGMVCYEALYYGLPVISSDCGGPAEMIEHGETGYLMPLHDIGAYADAMQNLISLPGLAYGFTEKSRGYLEASVQSHSGELSHYFEQVVNRQV
jgi:glycosyltransferase involved in cell wall biosynthesis